MPKFSYNVVFFVALLVFAIGKVLASLVMNYQVIV